MPVSLFLQAARIDPATGEYAEKWTDGEQSVSIPVSPVLEEKSYMPADEAEIMGYSLRRVEAKRHVTGVTLLAEEKMGRERHSPGSVYRKSAEGSMYDV